MHYKGKRGIIKRIAGIWLVMLLTALLPLGVESQTRRRSKGKTTTTVVKQTNPQTSAEAKKRQEAAQKEIRQTEVQIRENEANVKKNLAALGKLEQEISVTNKNISQLNTKIARLNGEITNLESGISKNEQELQRLREEYLKAVKKMRVTRKNKSTLAFIFSSKSVNQAMRRMRYLKEFSAWRGKQTEEIEQKTSQLKHQRDELANARVEQNAALAQQKNSKAKLAEQHKRQEVIVADLKRNGAALQSHLKKKQAEASELGNMVSRLIAEEQRKQAEEEARRKAAEEEARRKAEEEARRQQELLAQEEATEKVVETKEIKGKGNKYTKIETVKKVEKGSKPTDYADARKRAPRSENNKASDSNKAKEQVGLVSSNFQDMRGKLPRPTTGSFSITSRFGRQYMPDLPDVEYDNPGIDAETDAGALAQAVFKGKVSGVYLLPGYNTVVIVNHGNYYTVYGNISSPSVKTGDLVDTGTTLGRLALNEDDSSHSNIHFEVWKNREKLNPQDWLGPM